MIKKNLKLLIITSIAILLPVFAGLILWDKLPEKVPIHWNAEWEVDGFCSRPFAVFGLPLMMLALQWICVFATSADPKKQNHSGKILHFVFWLIPVMSILLSAFTYLIAIGKDVRIEMFSSMLVGLLFVAIGNYLPKCKQNYTIGIKIPWTLSSEENWNKTHRLTGWLWVICGLAIMLSGFLNFFPVIIAAIFIMVLVPLIYSYILYRKGT